MDTPARTVSPRELTRAIGVAEALVDLRETDILRLLLAVDPGVAEQLAGALAAGGGHAPTPTGPPRLRSVG